MPRITLPLVVFLAFTAYSLMVVAEHGFAELIELHAQGGWAVQVLLDLVLALTMFWVVAVPDAKTRGISPWPYVALTPLLGSIAPLAYFVHRSLRPRVGRA